MCALHLLANIWCRTKGYSLNWGHLIEILHYLSCFPCAKLVKIHMQCGKPWFDPWVGKILWRKERLPSLVFWLGEFHGLYSPWSGKMSDTIEQLSLFSIIFHTWVIAIKHILSLPVFISFKREHCPKLKPMTQSAHKILWDF